jgi:Zn-dependent protease
VTLDSIRTVLYLVVGLLVGLVVHEYAHAFVSLRLGDQTPKRDGRLTLNPRPHVDPFGTLILPALLLLPTLFGRGGFLPFVYAKPQEQNPWTLRKPQHTTLIALAGPTANVLLAFVFGTILRVTGCTGEMARFLGELLLVNVLLAAFNIVPIPPLDGSRVLVRYLPPRAAEFYRNLDPYGALFMLVIFFIIPGPISSFASAVGGGIARLVAGGCSPIQ